MSESDDRFLSRWSRRKHRSRQESAAGSTPIADPAASPRARTENPPPGPNVSGSGVVPGATVDVEPVPPVAPSTPGAEGIAVQRGDASGHGGESGRVSGYSSSTETPPLPAIESLTPASDFRPFMQAGVDALTRNSALKRLFADPHFNVMDGLDTYIDDYNKTEPIPAALLAGLKQLHSIGVTDDEPDDDAGIETQASAESVRDAEADEEQITRADVAYAPLRRETPAETGEQDEPEPPTDKTTPEEPSE